MIRKILSLFDITALVRVMWRHKNLLWQMTKRNVEARYKGSMLGLVWSFVYPLMMLCVYTFVFSVVFKARWGVDTAGGKGAFAVIMFCGMAMFNIFSESVLTCSGVIVGNQNLVKKVIFPLEVLPLSQVLTTFILGIAWFVLLFFGAYFVLHSLHWTMVLLPCVLLPMVIFTLGVSYFTAALGVFIRDTQYAIGVITQILFFATPIFYPIEAVPVNFQRVLRANPLTAMIDAARDVFLYGRLPNWHYLMVATIISLAVLQLGFFFFQRTKRGFADVL